MPAPKSGADLAFEGTIGGDVSVARGSSSPGGDWESGKEGVFRGRKRTMVVYLDNHMETVELRGLLSPPDDTAAIKKANRFWLTY